MDKIENFATSIKHNNDWPQYITSDECIILLVSCYSKYKRLKQHYVHSEIITIYISISFHSEIITLYISNMINNHSLNFVLMSKAKYISHLSKLNFIIIITIAISGISHL